MKAYFDPCETHWNGGCTEPAVIGAKLCKYHKQMDIDDRQKEAQDSRKVMELDMWEFVLRDIEEREEQEAC